MVRPALAGLAALAAAMGIGRFAFTPLLPLMQAEGGMSLADGGYLASANYLGYLVGALTAARVRLALPVSLFAIAAATLAMGFTHGIVAWLGRMYGQSLIRAMQQYSRPIIWTLIVLAILGGMAFAAFIWRRKQQGLPALHSAEKKAA